MIPSSSLLRHRSFVVLSLFLLVGALSVFAAPVEAGPSTSGNHVHIYVVGGSRSCNSPGTPPVFPVGTDVEVGFCVQNALGMGDSGETVSWEVSNANIVGTPDGTTNASGEARITVDRSSDGTGAVKGTWVAGNQSATVQITWGTTPPPTDHIHLLTAKGSVGNVCHTNSQSPAGNATAASDDDKDVEADQNLHVCLHEADHDPVVGRTAFLDTRNLGSATAPVLLNGQTGSDGSHTFTYDSETAGKTVSRGLGDGKVSPNSMTITWKRPTDHVHVFVQGQGSCHSGADPATVPIGQEVKVIACVHGADQDGIPDSRSDPSTGSDSPREVSFTLSGDGTMTQTSESIRADANGQAFVKLESEDPGSGRVIASQSGKSGDVDINFACRRLDTSFFAYAANFTGGVYVATGDVNGDGCDDIITGAGAGGGPHVQVFHANGTRLAQGFPYASNFTGGVRVGVGDVDGDGKDEVITGPGPSGGPHVKVFDVGGGGLNLRNQFMAYNPAFTGGIFVAGGDVGGPDDKAEVITGPDQTGGPHIKVFNAGGGVIAQTMVYNPGFTGGVRVGTVEMDGGSRVELVTGAGPGGGPHVRTFDIVGAGFSPKTSFFAFAPGFTGGIFVGGGEAISSSSREEIAVGADAGGGPHVRLFNGGGGVLSSFFAYNPAFTGGVRVAIGDGDSDGNGELVTAPGAGGGPHIRVFE